MRPKAEWAIDSEAMRARGGLVVGCFFFQMDGPMTGGGGYK